MEGVNVPSVNLLPRPRQRPASRQHIVIATAGIGLGLTSVGHWSGSSYSARWGANISLIASSATCGKSPTRTFRISANMRA